jgi:hypothetical protein
MISSKLPVSSASAESVVFVDVGPSYAMICGGLTVLERSLREAGKRGVTRALVAAPPIMLRPSLRVGVEWLPPGSPPPAGVPVISGREVAGVAVIDATSLAEAERALIAGLGKSHEGPVDQYFNSRFSRPLTRLFMKTSITPNQITTISVIIGVIGALWVLRGDWASLALGGTLLQLQCVLDSCDGEIARLKYLHSKLGMWLDTMTDGIIDNGFVACCAIAAGGWWQTFGLAHVAARLLCEVYVYQDVIRKTGTPDQTRFRMWFEDQTAATETIYDRSTFTAWFRIMGRRDTVILVFWLLSLTGKPQVVVVYAGLLNLISFIGVFVDLTMKLVARTRR